MVAGRGFEPLKAYAGDFTDRSLWPLGHPADLTGERITNAGREDSHREELGRTGVAVAL
jgi:hypothetical protein